MPELDEEIVEVLEANLQFLRDNPDDQNRYYVGPDALTAVAWVVTAIALPILLTGANEVVKSKVQDWLKKRNREDIAKNLAEGHGKSAGGESQGAPEAIAEVAAYLSKRGWPNPMAQSDAKEIVGLLAEKLK